MSPYVELTEFAEIINKLAIKSNDSGMEVRCIMPRFGIINERRHRLHGVYPALMKICDEQFQIPMTGDFESLNVSVATGIILYEAMKQRLA